MPIPEEHRNNEYKPGRPEKLRHLNASQKLAFIQLVSDELCLVILEAGGSLPIQDALLRVAKGLDLETNEVRYCVGYAKMHNLITINTDNETIETGFPQS